jgi:hypothetical protein
LMDGMLLRSYMNCRVLDMMVWMVWMVWMV